jgi:alpha-ketoglutarate-dependent taurine dioxygenase
MQDVIDIEVTPLSAACGAEIKGIDLTRPLSDEAVRAVKDAWAKHLVLVFRGQTLSQDDQLRFASYCPDPAPFSRGASGTKSRLPCEMPASSIRRRRPARRSLLRSHW